MEATKKASNAFPDVISPTFSSHHCWCPSVIKEQTGNFRRRESKYFSHTFSAHWGIPTLQLPRCASILRAVEFGSLKILANFWRPETPTYFCSKQCKIEKVGPARFRNFSLLTTFHAEILFSALLLSHSDESGDNLPSLFKGLLLILHEAWRWSSFQISFP